jgi:2-keto-3-deoxy-L-fuconate dehydrogenase
MKILVTGAANGLGKAIYELLVKNGHDVHAFDWQYGDDVRYPAARMMPEDIDVLDVLINCAGINTNSWFEDVDDSEISSVMDINAVGIVKMAQEFLPLLKASKGTVINIVSNAAHIPMTSSLAYNGNETNGA